MLTLGLVVAGLLAGAFVLFAALAVIGWWQLSKTQPADDE